MNKRLLLRLEIVIIAQSADLPALDPAGQGARGADVDILDKNGIYLFCLVGNEGGPESNGQGGKISGPFPSPGKISREFKRDLEIVIDKGRILDILV